jgi:hypothetical protein
LSPVGSCITCPVGYSCPGNSYIYDEVAYPRFPITQYGATTVGDTTVVLTVSWNTSIGEALFMDKDRTTELNTGDIYQSNGNAINNFVSGYNGEWIKIDYGEAFVPSILRFMPAQIDETKVSGMPFTFRIYATNDENVAGNTDAVGWTILDYTMTGQNKNILYIAGAWYENEIHTDIAYQHYFIVVKKIYYRQTFMALTELEFSHVISRNEVQVLVGIESFTRMV